MFDWGLAWSVVGGIAALAAAVFGYLGWRAVLDGEIPAVVPYSVGPIYNPPRFALTAFGERAAAWQFQSVRLVDPEGTLRRDSKTDEAPYVACEEGLWAVSERRAFKYQAHLKPGQLLELEVKMISNRGRKVTRRVFYTPH